MRLAGDELTSLALDMMAGLTVAVLHHNEERLPVGAHAGGNAGVSLDFRARHFVIALGMQYRVLVASERALNGSETGVEHAVTGTLGFGFSIY